MVQAYLDSIHFSSLEATLYTGSLKSLVTPSQAANYFLNTDYIFQLGDVVIRPIDPTMNAVGWKFLLALKASNLSATSYASLAGGTYDPSVMNQFSTNPYSDNLDLSVFMGNVQSGYAETDDNSTVSARRPMFGHGDWSNTTCTLISENNWIDQNGDGDPDPTYSQCRKRRTYVFWVGVGWDNDCYYAYGCD